MWLIAEYAATALFSLKPAWATSSGGRTLLVPTPFAIKMALLDVVCRAEGVDSAQAAWEGWLRDLPVALRPARQAVVNNTFTKILKPRRKEAEPGTAHVGPFQKTIGYREYVYLEGPLGIGLEVSDQAQIAPLTQWLAGINYLGKRGGFVQLLDVPAQVEYLPDDYILIAPAIGAAIPIPSLMQQLDECGPSLTFEKASIYTDAKIELNKDRLLHPVALPYRVVASSRGYTWYARSDPKQP